MWAKNLELKVFNDMESEQSPNVFINKPNQDMSPVFFFSILPASPEVSECTCMEKKPDNFLTVSFPISSSYDVGLNRTCP